MAKPQRLPDEYLATLPEDDPLRQAQEAIDRMREARLHAARGRPQEGPLVRAARAVERALGVGR